MTNHMGQSHQKPEEAERILPWGLGRERGPDDTFVSDVGPPGLRVKLYVLTQVSQFVVISYGSRRVQTRVPGSLTVCGLSLGASLCSPPMTISCRQRLWP